ncbi:hypothetical protein BDV25DRAFT_136934 [Aspergillus avenaceus]|uniref:Uncharacterized protein n=1 Tax=Aspergillus avenaceus TaxID=36643 RepID=A0A5N6U412_ASPAV|nr:hypothetical protein BDV25DRAFT_136934 [Aspergillus avenaceus]
MHLLSLLTTASLALFTTSAVAGAPVAHVDIRDAEDSPYLATDRKCITRPEEDQYVPIQSIIIIPVLGDYDDGKVKCTFYEEPECDGNKYTLKEGHHVFRHRFVAASFKCSR